MITFCFLFFFFTDELIDAINGDINFAVDRVTNAEAFAMQQNDSLFRTGVQSTTLSEDITKQQLDNNNNNIDDDDKKNRR